MLTVFHRTTRDPPVPLAVRAVLGCAFESEHVPVVHRPTFSTPNLRASSSGSMSAPITFPLKSRM